MQQEHQGNISSDGANQTPHIAGADQDITLDVLINQIEFIRELTVSQNPDDLSQRLISVLNRFGFSDFALMRCSLSQASNFFLTSLPKELLDDYRKQRLYQHDMVLDYLKTGNPIPLHYSTIQRAIENASFLTHTFAQNLEILALYQQFEFSDAYVIPIQIHSGGKGDEEGLLFSVLARGVNQEEFVKMTEKCGAILRLLGDAVIRIYNTKFGDGKPKPVINPKPMRLLTTIAKHDLTLSQAADHLCIGVDTANKHISLAKKALGTRSQANAVYLALKQGLIDFS